MLVVRTQSVRDLDRCEHSMDVYSIHSGSASPFALSIFRYVGGELEERQRGRAHPHRGGRNTLQIRDPPIVRAGRGRRTNAPEMRVGFLKRCDTHDEVSCD